MTTKTVAILGGGVAGMSAAHELIERGFQVAVYERRAHPGGKARSMGDPGTGTDGRPDLPGEHGFRFFPGFYKHLPDTMKRIPFADQPSGVFGNLVEARQFQIARSGAPSPIFVARFPTSLDELYQALKDVFTSDLGIPDEELLYFADRIFVVLTSCQERRLAEYEKITWWDFIGAGTRSLAYQRYLAEGLTRSLVAMKAEIGSSRTVGDILVQLMLDLGTPGVSMDRVLAGPTNEMWLTPWLEYLRQRGVAFHLDTTIEAIHCAQGRITEVIARTTGGAPFEIAADYFISALPVEVLTPLLTPEMVAADPGLAKLASLHTEWMSGIQFYLKDDVPLVEGHTVYSDSPYALTSISQAQFWRTAPTAYGNGTVKGVLSVDISDWNAKGIVYPDKTAMQLSAAEIKAEVWAQVRSGLDQDPGAAGLTDANLVGWHLDPDIVFPNPAGATVNLEPLLVNVVDSWKNRPEARTQIPNLFLASDFVRTYTDLATMEGANEAARRAVNGILDASSSLAPRCQLWPLEEPEIFAPLRAYDYIRFSLGLPYGGL